MHQAFFFPLSLFAKKRRLNHRWALDLLNYALWLVKTFTVPPLAPRAGIHIPRGCAPFGQHQESWPLAMGRCNPITLPMLRVKSDEFYAHAQKIRLDQRSWFLVLAKRSAASRDENALEGKPNTLCSSRKYPCPPLGRLTEILRGRGVSKAQFFKWKYDTKTEFLEGWGGGGSN